jgi:hypothetical protein
MKRKNEVGNYESWECFSTGLPEKRVWPKREDVWGEEKKTAEIVFPTWQQAEQEEDNNKKNSMVLVHERTIQTERPPLVGEVIANFCG